MPSATRAGAATWDRHASRYAAQTRFELRAVWAAVGLADPDPGELVLDVGTGTGLVLDILRIRPRVPREVLAVDRSAGMLATIGALPAGWAALRGDAAALPLPDGCVDVVVAAYVLHLLRAPERAAVLAELRRVAAPRARLVTVTPHVPRRGTARLGAAALDTAARVAPRRFGGLRTLDPRDDLAAAGFRVERAARVRHGYPSLVVLARRA